MRFSLYLCLFFVPCLSLFSDDSLDQEQYAPLFDFETAPSAVVGGVVNVISGRYFETETDYVSPSANPIRIERSYSNGAVALGYLHGYWDLNIGGKVYWRLKYSHERAQVNDRGQRTVFEGEKNQDLKLNEGLLKKGVCNCAPSKLAGLTTLKRKSFECIKGRVLLHNGLDKAYYGIRSEPGHYSLTDILIPNGCSYHYDYDKGLRVNGMKSFDSEDRKLDGLTFINHPPHPTTQKRTVELVSDEGMKVTYRLNPYKAGKDCTLYSVASVETNFSPTVRYEYLTRDKRKPELLTKKSYPEGRFLKIDYVEGHHKQRRVIALSAPVVDQEPVPLYTFKYKRKKAYVWDVLGNRTTYRWNDDERLTSIRHHWNSGDLYRSEEIRWGSYEGRKDASHLRARHLLDSSGRIWMSKRFFNDKYGRVVKEVLYGNLSGQGKKRDSIHDQSGEKYIKEYTYHGLYVSSEKIGVLGDKFKQKINYAYYKGTSLIKRKLVSDEEGIRERYYYEYAPCGVPVYEIVDDGNTYSVNSLDGVTQRTIKRTKLTPKGLPCEEIQEYLDLSTMSTVQLSRVVTHYSKRGLVTQKDYYDANDDYAYSEFWKYNAHGRVVEEVDRGGRSTYYAYDGVGNCISKRIPHQEVETLYTYDYGNRLIKEEERHDDGRIYVKSNTYDLKGNRISEIDAQGNETLYTYDEFDRVIEKTLPAIQNENGELTHGSERYEYDIFNHLTAKIDEAGKTTRIACNYYGKPSRIEHPDKTVERAIYYYDGSLKLATDSQKTRTWYEYDYKGRKTCENKHEHRGALLSAKSWKYGAFNLLEEVDAEGYATRYSYDGAGRLIAQRRGEEETLIFYDSLSREKEKWEKCGDSSYRVTVVEYDLFDQVIEERIEDENGNLYFMKTFAYDAWGNQIRETVYNQDLASTTETEYNSSGQLIRSITPDGNEILYFYDDDFVNAFGQTVQKVMTIDPKGNVTTKIYDTRGQVSFEEKLNTYAESVQKIEYIYDQKGNVTLQRENVIVGDEVLRVHCTAFEYDLRGREIAVIEAKGEPEQKITRRTYTSFGEVEEIQKPSGIIIRHQYDKLGRLAALTSSDGSIDYAYTYDGNHQVVDVEDCLVHSHTKRQYDPCGNMVCETTALGITQQYAYDSLSRLTELTLSDNSTINYGYDAGYLREINRGDYSHCDHYGVSGKREASELAGSVGVIEYVYDQAVRPQKVTSPSHSMDLVFDAIGNVTQVDYADDRGEETYLFTYDDLNQLTSDNAHTYEFDSLGNRVSYDDEDAVHNALNQLLRQGETHYGYDTNGNLISKNSQMYRYDALDRMTEVVDGDSRTTYMYDPFHRRLAKTRYINQEGEWIELSKERYLYQGDKEIGVIDEEGQIIELRVMGVGVSGEVGAAVLMELRGNVYVPLHDWRGNVSVLIDVETHEVVESYRYDAFGVETAESPINPWRFSSKRVDPETGFSYFGARYYDSESGRWTTPDPMWFVDGTHLYCYVRNNPTMFIDPEGLFLSYVADFIRESVESLFEFTRDYTNITMDERGTLQVNIAGMPPSLDHRSGYMPPVDGVFGEVHVMTINGINNSLEESSEFCQYVSGMAEGCTSSFVYNATHSAFWDLVESGFNIHGVSTRPQALLHHAWDDFFANCPSENSIVIMVAHSQGAILTRNALANYDPERRERIHVIAIAPGAYIDEGKCGSVQHLVSNWDIVPLIDFWGRLRNSHTIQYLERHPEASYFDHRAKSPTYADNIRQRILKVIEGTGVR